MSPDDFLMISVVSATVGALVAVVLSAMFASGRSFRVRRAHWLAIGVEVATIEFECLEFLATDVQSPLGRMPTLAYRTAFPALLEHGSLDENEAIIFGLLYGKVEELNRGLDNANHFLLTDNHNSLTSLHGRNRMKAEQLRSLIEDATDQLQYHRTLNPWKRLKLTLKTYQAQRQRIATMIRSIDTQ